MVDKTNSAVAASFSRVNAKVSGPNKQANPNRTPEQAFTEHNQQVAAQNTPSSSNPVAVQEYTGPIGPQEQPKVQQQQQNEVQKLQNQSLQPKVANQQQINQSNLYFNTPGEKEALRQYNISQNEDVLLPIAQRNIQEYRTKTSPTSGTRLIGTELQANYNVAVQKETQFFNQRADESVKTVAFSVGAGYGLGALGAAAPLLGKGLAIAAIPVTAKRTYDIGSMYKDTPNAARYQTMKFGVELGGMAFGGYLGAKDIAGLKKPAFEVTRATEPLIIRKGTEQYLVTKQYTELVDVAPKVDDRIGISYKQLSEKTIGSPETIQAQIRTSTIGKGFVDLQTKEFNPGYNPKQQKELFNVGEFARSPEKYVISSREQVIETKITPDLSLLEKYNAVKVSKSQEVVTKLQNAPEDNILSFTKGKFFKQSRALALYEEKPSSSSIPIPKIKIPESKPLTIHKEISGPEIKMSGQGFNPGRSGLGTETIMKSASVKEVTFEPVVSVKKVTPKTSTKLSPVLGESSIKNIKISNPTELKMFQETRSSGRVSRQLQQSEVIQRPRTPSPVNIVRISNVSGSSRISIPMTSQTPRTEQIPEILPKSIQQTSKSAKTEQSAYGGYKSRAYTPKSPELPKELRSRPRKSAQSVQAFNVEVKRGGKFKTIFTGLTRSQALSKGSKLTENTLARTFRIRASGRTLSNKKGFGFNTGRFYQKKGKKDTFIQKARFSLGTFGERGEIQGAKRVKRFKF